MNNNMDFTNTILKNKYRVKYFSGKKELDIPSNATKNFGISFIDKTNVSLALSLGNTNGLINPSLITSLTMIFIELTDGADKVLDIMELPIDKETIKYKLEGSYGNEDILTYEIRCRLKKK